MLSNTITTQMVVYLEIAKAPHKMAHGIFDIVQFNAGFFVL
jgi:hypothetical protein